MVCPGAGILGDKDIQVTGNPPKEGNEKKYDDTCRYGGGYGIHVVIGKKDAVGKLHHRCGGHAQDQRQAHRKNVFISVVHIPRL